MKNVISAMTIIGPALWLVYFWRRLTTKAVIIQMLISILTTAVLPAVGPMIEGIRTNPHLTVQSPERVYTISTGALQEDVALGRANSVGQVIQKRKVQPPVAVYVEEVVGENEADPHSRLVGKGFFKDQIYICSLVGIPVERMNKSELSTVSLVFDVVFPFILLFAISLVTKRNSQKTLQEFYAAIHTPTVADPEEDARRVREAIDHPELVEQRKLFPHTDWEFWKPTTADVWGFISCWVLVVGVMLLYVMLMNIGR